MPSSKFFIIWEMHRSGTPFTGFLAVRLRFVDWQRMIECEPR